MPVEYWFPTPIYHDYVSNRDHINSELIKTFEKMSFEKQEFWGEKTHSVSDASFSSNFIEQFNLLEFQKEINLHVSQYVKLLGSSRSNFKIKSSWFTNTIPGEYTRTHNHSYSDISGVYYLKTNQRDGDLTFLSPNPCLSLTLFAKLGDTVSYKPENGKIVLFPGWLYHSVTENDTDENRISVSFNIYFEK
jgi:uncharacterized protein (TIGR02466 family)